uniref:non-specific serine/threonine protein kinase n=1 Tax=Schizaphis graminum TaxID=13262 RepID=A0A2S2P335_SCHGA
MFLAYRNKFNSISSKKRKKTKSKKKLLHTVNTLNSSELSLQLENSHVNSSNVSMNIIDDYNDPFDQSVQISSWKHPSLNKYSENRTPNNQLVNSSNRPDKIKKIINPCSKEKNSNWYHKVLDIFGDETITLEKSKNQDILTSEEYIDSNSNFEPVLTYETKQLMLLEQQKQSLPLSNLNNISFKSLKHFNKSSSGKENHSILSLNHSKPCKENSIITIDNTKDGIIEESQSSKPYVNADHTIQNEVKSFLNNSFTLSQEYSKISCADPLDLKLLSILDRIDNNKKSSCPQNNENSLTSFEENIGLQSDDDEIICCSPDSDPKKLLDITNKFSDIIIDEQCDKSINEESLFEEFDHTLCMSFETSNHKHDISNNSSILQSSSSLEQNTVIYKQNCTDVFYKKENSDSNLLLNDRSIELKTSSILCDSKEDTLKYNDESYRHINVSNNEYIDPEKTNSNNPINISNSVSNDLLEKSELNLSVMPRRRYAARFQSLDIIKESSQLETILPDQNTSVFHLEPGKKWRRSISIVRNYTDSNKNQSTNFTKGRKWAFTVDDILRQQCINTSIHQNLDQSNVLKNSICSQNLHLKSIDLENQKARNYIFEACNQQELISFESWLGPKCTNKWKKVGEGVYGEVFSYSNGNQCTIVKIIPVEGEVNINSENQKKMFEVYSEIIIATELNKLWNKSNLNQTSSFCKLKRVSCVKGKYPNILINYWQKYDNDKGSDNDNPNILPKDQIFMILEMENGGIDVENFIFNSADQSLFAFLQIVFGLAVAEEEYKFEHRDLHIGNILIKKCSNKNISYKLEGEYFNVPSRGIKITIIDFTLSRMTYNSKHVYNDLAKDTELFTSVGDYQFDIYRMMKKETNDQWESFKPATNIYWLHYVLDKMLLSVHYKKTNTILHNNGRSILEQLKNIILSFNSAKSFAESDLVLNLIGYKKL